MKRTDASGHDGNRYTAGNPALNIPATVVGAEELNNIQEEIANIIEAASITLDGSDEDQLLEAFNKGIAEGGLGGSTLNVNQSILDNQASAVTINGLEFSASNEKAVEIRYHVIRRDDGQHYVEAGKMLLFYDDESAAWSLSVEANDHPGSTEAPGQITFSVNASGQIQYTSTNFGGANYSGTIRASFSKVVA